MAGRGFPPAPLAIKLLKGNSGRGPLNTKEPKVPPGIPEAPEHLDEVARVEWARLVRPLAAAGILTSFDRAGLAAICVLWARWVGAEDKLRAEGAVIRSGKRGLPRRNPHLGIATTTLEQLLGGGDLSVH